LKQIFCIEATVTTLQARGIEVNPIKMGKDYSFQAWITDPDGNHLELHVYTPASWQAHSLA
jgi:predicted enzyme related to lactoylglutathione lyase